MQPVPILMMRLARNRVITRVFLVLVFALSFPSKRKLEEHGCESKKTRLKLDPSVARPIGSSGSNDPGRTSWKVLRQSRVQNQ